jgi:maltose-binding protein MalE
MIQSANSIEILPPDPSYQELVGIIQNATGIVATGEVTAAESAHRYSDELTRVLGAENVVKQSCQ